MTHQTKDLSQFSKTQHTAKLQYIINKLLFGMQNIKNAAQ